MLSKSRKDKTIRLVMAHVYVERLQFGIQNPVTIALYTRYICQSTVVILSRKVVDTWTQA
jgi:hypothetical protein